MNLLIFLDLSYNPCKNFNFLLPQGQNVQIFLIFTYNQGKIFFILPITQGGGGGGGEGACIPSLHWETRVGATSLEVISTLNLDCPWGWGFGMDCFQTECTMSQPGLKRSLLVFNYTIKGRF